MASRDDQPGARRPAHRPSGGLDGVGARETGRDPVRTIAAAALFWGALALVGLAVAAIALGRGTPVEAIGALPALIYAVVGRLLVARRPRNAVGWILALIGVVLALGALIDVYMTGGAQDDATQLAGWLKQLVWFVWLPGLVGIALPLLFPDGRLPSRRWRWVAWAGALGTLLAMLATGLEPGPMEVEGAVENPFGIAGADGLLSVAEGLGFALTTVAVAGAGAAVIVRLRRSRGVERQQLKWFAYVASLMVLGFTAASSTALTGDSSAWSQVMGPAGWFTALAMVAIGIPVATGIAVLRHRLYDIDLVINRTLVYVALTAMLGGAYLASVLLLQLVLSPSSDLAIAGSTLAVAALFRPLRSRIQALVDRRFYRRRYDAARTIEAFGVHARDEVSLEALSEELRAVVAHTVQPAHVSLWLRETAR